MSTRNRMDDVSSADLRPDSLVGSYFLGTTSRGWSLPSRPPASTWSNWRLDRRRLDHATARRHRHPAARRHRGNGRVAVLRHGREDEE